MTRYIAFLFFLVLDQTQAENRCPLLLEEIGNQALSDLHIETEFHFSTTWEKMDEEEEEALNDLHSAGFEEGTIRWVRCEQGYEVQGKDAKSQIICKQRSWVWVDETPQCILHDEGDHEMKIQSFKEEFQNMLFGGASLMLNEFEIEKLLDKGNWNLQKTIDGYYELCTLGYQIREIHYIFPGFDVPLIGHEREQLALLTQFRKNSLEFNDWDIRVTIAQRKAVKQISLFFRLRKFVERMGEITQTRDDEKRLRTVISILNENVFRQKNEKLAFVSYMLNIIFGFWLLYLSLKACLIHRKRADHFDDNVEYMQLDSPQV